MELEQEVFGLVATLVDQVLMEESDEMLSVEEADGMGEAAEVAEYGSELGNSIVDSIVYSVPLTEPTELETVGSSYHLHKIDQIVHQVEVE
jgi:hypothetical protein